MSRSGYTDVTENPWSHIMWRGAVASALRGKRGQAFLVELRDALDALPEKRLAAHSFQSPEGEFCTLGVIGSKRGIEMTDLAPPSNSEWDDSCDADRVSDRFGIAAAMAREIMWMNDEFHYGEERPEYRWRRMRRWVDEQIATPTNTPTQDIEQT